MCFTVNVNLVKEELEKRYGATLIDPENYRPSYYYHAFALPKMPVIPSEDTSILKLMTWGLIPESTKEADQAEIVRYKTFNARAESINSLKSFYSAFRTKRCIVPVKGFFEWQHVGKEKIPWYVYQADDEILSLAGVYSDWISNATGEMISTFSIVTTEANDLMANIHNSGKRMPVILDKSSEKEWTCISLSQSDAVNLLKPCHSDFLKAHTISKLINNKMAEKNSSDIVKPYCYSQDNLLF